MPTAGLTITTVFLVIAVLVCFFRVTAYAVGESYYRHCRYQRKRFHVTWWILTFTIMLVITILLGLFLSPMLGEITILPAWGWFLAIFLPSAAGSYEGFKNA